MTKVKDSRVLIQIFPTTETQRASEKFTEQDKVGIYKVWYVFWMNKIVSQVYIFTAGQNVSHISLHNILICENFHRFHRNYTGFASCMDQGCLHIHHQQTCFLSFCFQRPKIWFLIATFCAFSMFGQPTCFSCAKKRHTVTHRVVFHLVWLLWVMEL